MQSHSMREKYEDLVNGNLPLPVHYKHLLNLFSTLDQVIGLLKNSKKVLNLTNIKNAISNQI